jgi:hypothetical protein
VLDSLIFAENLGRTLGTGSRLNPAAIYCGTRAHRAAPQGGKLTICDARAMTDLFAFN